jgi:pyruvate,water dikinase
VAAILWLDEVEERDRGRVGAKAFTLARLRRDGFPVPDGFVLLAADGSLDPAREAVLRAAYARLGGAVAARSSSTLEDLEAASFAGQYRTVLDVRGEEDVVRAARTCLESAGAAAGYARAVGATETGAMAVLVQRFVEARAAGVVFTRHPRDRSALVVESHAGRVEAVVSGAVRPDRYVVDRATGATREGPSAASLDPADLALVVALARKVEDRLGAPQDVEWAVSPAGVALLQSRPITTAGEAWDEIDPRVRYLTRANVGEVMPDAVTPLTWTTVAAFLEHGFQAVTATAGLRPRDAPPFLVLYRHHLYLNLSLSAQVGARLPGVSAQDAERLVLGGGAGATLPRVGAAGLLALSGVAMRLLGLARRLPAEVEACAEIVRGLPSAAAIDAAAPGALGRMLRGFLLTGRRVATAHIAVSGASAVRLAVLGRVIPAAGPSAARVNRLVAGLEDIESVEPATALEAIAAEAADRPEWSAWLRRPAEETATELRRGRAPAGLAPRLDAFLARFGHRAVSEGELRAAAWEDDAVPVLGALHGMLDTTGAPGFGRRAAAETRRAEEEALLAPLGLVRRAVVRQTLVGAQNGIRARERTKSLAIALVHHGRRLARAAARHLVETGAIADADDVYFLTLDELVSALEGGAVPRAAIGRRRRAHARASGLAVPRDVDLRGGAPDAGPAAPEASAPLAGLGVSGGVASGPARVVVDAARARLEPGEVLVAPVLDAGYGPLLAVAAGAVAEVGGLLSHGSVVARELGVPCVVDVPGATRRIATGDRVTVNGDSGTITLVKDGGGTTAAQAEPDLLACDPADEGRPHPLEGHPLARESVYFNVQDKAAGVVIVASLGVRPRAAGESLLAIGLPDGRVLFGLDRGAARVAEELAVGGAAAAWRPVRLRAATRLSIHEGRGFPPAPVPLLLAPRTAAVSLDLAFVPATPAVDLCAGLPPDVLLALRPLGDHHVEQSGAWRGTVVVDGTGFDVAGTGSRDHSWGRRDWAAADHWRLFTARLGDDLAVHALAVGVRGRLVEGGFVWRGGRAERITRVRCAAQREDEALRSFELEVVTAAGPPLRLRGRVWRTVTVPVQLERRPWRHLVGRPYRLTLQENFTVYEGEGRMGQGMAELTQRPG